MSTAPSADTPGVRNGYSGGNHCEIQKDQAPLCRGGDILGLEFSFYHPSLQEVTLQTAFISGGSKGKMNPRRGDSTPRNILEQSP